MFMIFIARFVAHTKLLATNLNKLKLYSQEMVILSTFQIIVYLDFLIVSKFFNCLNNKLNFCTLTNFSLIFFLALKSFGATSSF